MNENNFVQILVENSLSKAIKRMGKEKVLNVIEGISNPIFRAKYRIEYFKFIEKNNY